MHAMPLVDGWPDEGFLKTASASVRPSADIFRYGNADHAMTTAQVGLASSKT